MIRFLRNLFFMFFIVVISYILGLNLMEEILPDLYKPNILYQTKDGLLLRKIEESKTVKDVDVLFLGSSHSYRSFDPLIFEREGISTYNWGTAQQTHIQTQMILKNYLNTIKPKLIVYEVFPEIFTMKGKESMSDFLNAGAPFEVGFMDIFIFDNSIPLLNTYLLKQSRYFFEQKRTLNKSLNKVNYNRGYVENKESRNLKNLNLRIKWTPLNSQLKAFQENLELINDHNIPVIFVIAPYPFEYSNKEEIDFYLNSKGVLYNYNRILDFDRKTNFSDVHHVNYLGVKKMNLHLVPILKKILSED